MQLEIEDFQAYWECITPIEAQKTLIDLKVADFPNMKREARGKTHKAFHKLAYPKTHDPGEVLTTQELANRLKAAIYG